MDLSRNITRKSHAARNCTAIDHDRLAIGPTFHQIKTALAIKDGGEAFATELHADTRDLQWVVDGYTLSNEYPYSSRAPRTHPSALRLPTG